MFIGPASTVTSWLASQLTQSGSTTQASATGTTAGTTSSATGPSATALAALSQVGIQAQNGSQALQSFMQNLFSTLQAQGASASTPSAASTSSVGAVSGHKGGHGHGHMEQEVQGLIQDLNSSTTFQPEYGLQRLNRCLARAAAAELSKSGRGIRIDREQPDTRWLSGRLSAGSAQPRPSRQYSEHASLSRRAPTGH